MTLIGANGLTGLGGASTTFAQLIGAAGTSAPQSSLVPLGQTTTFRTGGASGNVVLITDTLSGTTPIPADAPSATFEMVAWDNSSGLYSSWATASVAWAAGLIAAGESAEFTVLGIGGTGNPPNTVLNGSFNIYTIPEPTSFALLGLGAAALMIFRRRK
jgi:hypothetical protein